MIRNHVGISYRKKPVVVQAVQWRGDLAAFDVIGIPERQRFVAQQDGALIFAWNARSHCAPLNWWAVKFDDDSFDILGPEEFAATYEPIPEHKPSGE